MKSLSEVLTTTKTIAEQSVKSNDISNMPVHGSTTEDGKMNTQSQSKREGSQKQNQNTNEQKKPLVLREDAEGRKKLSRLLLISFDVLDTFGKEAEQLENINAAFQMYLEDYTYNQVEQAFKIYMKASSVMPKPADIVKIIDPPKPKRKWCGATFIDIRRRIRENQFITDEEQKYCSDFIQAQITAPEEERGLIDDAIRQVEQQNKQYWIEN